MSENGARPEEAVLGDDLEALDEAMADSMDAQEQAIDLSDLLNLLRESIIDHELRIMQIEDFLKNLYEQIVAEAEAITSESGDESPESGV